MKTRTGKFLMAAAAAFLFAWPGGVMAAENGTESAESKAETVAAEPFKLQGILRKGKQVVQNALYLDKGSIQVIDVDEEYVTVTADLLETANEKDFRRRSILFRMSAEGEQSVFGEDAAWHTFSGATDDPVAVASREVWQEMGKAERRDEFLQQIQQILVKKAEAAEAEKEKQENTEPAPAEASAETKETENAPTEIFVEIPPETPAPETSTVSGENSGKRKKEAVKKEKETKPAEKGIKATAEPQIVVEIETRE